MGTWLCFCLSWYQVFGGFEKPERKLKPFRVPHPEKKKRKKWHAEGPIDNLPGQGFLKPGGASHFPSKMVPFAGFTVTRVVSRVASPRGSWFKEGFGFGNWGRATGKRNMSQLMCCFFSCASHQQSTVKSRTKEGNPCRVPIKGKKSILGH